MLDIESKIATAQKFDDIVFKVSRAPGNSLAPLVDNGVNRLGFGIDSLTAGTSYVDLVAKAMLGSTSLPGARYDSFLETSIGGATAGIRYLDDIADYGHELKTHSLDGRGVYTINGTQDSFSVFNMQSGQEANFHTIRVFYLKQPGGGTFKVSHLGNNVATIDTNSTSSSVAFIDVPKFIGAPSTKLEFTEINGNVVIFSRLTLSASDVVEDHFFTIQVAKGGQSVQKFATLNSTSQIEWYSQLKLDAFLLNCGTNSRFSRTGAEVRSDAETFLAPISASGADIGILIPTETSDSASTNYFDIAEAMTQLAKDNNYGYLNLPEVVGNYAFVSANFGMNADGIHPTQDTQNQVGVRIANELLFNSATSKQLLAPYNSGVAGSIFTPYTIDVDSFVSRVDNMTAGVDGVLYKLALSGPWIFAVVHLDIYVRADPDITSYIARRISVYLRRTSVSGVSSFTIDSNNIISESRSGGWAALDFTVGASIVGDNLEITVNPNLDSDVSGNLSGYQILKANAIVDNPVVSLPL